MTDLLTKAAPFFAEGKGEATVAKALGIKRHRARALELEYWQRQSRKRQGQSTALAIPQKPGGMLEIYDAACRALAEATAINDVLPLLDQVEHVKLHAKKVKNQQLLADAAAFQLRAERRLGQIVIAAREAEGHFKSGGRNSKNTAPEFLPRATLAEVGVDAKLSSKAQRLARIDEKTFEANNEALRERIISGAAKVVDREAATQEKQTRRESRERILGLHQQALPQQKFGIIVADPEWRFEPWSRETGMDRAADNHYPTSCTEVIASRDVAAIAADDCVLFLWATGPMIREALMVMEAWGFEYKSMAVWNKLRDDQAHGLRKLAVGTGYWFRSAHELLLVGTRGDVPAPAAGTQWCSSIDAAIGAHSEKPEVFLEMIDELFPTLPKIELNRRGPARAGWKAWGFEAEQLEAAE